MTKRQGENMIDLEKYRLTKQGMVEAVWKAGNKYEESGGNLDDITQELRFAWIADAQLANLLPLLEEARREERERIATYIERNLEWANEENEMMWKDQLKYWQALQKEGEKEKEAL